MKILKKISSWFYNKSLNKFILELERRREEVVNRARHAADHTFPDHLLELPITELFKWIIDPHIEPIYKEYKYIKSEIERSAEHAVYNIMDLREKLQKIQPKKEDENEEERIKT